MKFTLRSASSAALLVGLAGSVQAVAQQAPAPAPQTVQPSQVAEPPASQAADRVVVTGSYIAGTPEDAALPVEVFTQEDLEQQGAPTALEFAKNLTISGPTTGEAYYFSGAQLTGSVNFNLRGLGSDKTLVLLNGRRMSQNTSNIPSAAIARTEVLKDGAAVTYGADATGGVVNFITRDNFVGLETSAQYKMIDGSNGDYGASILGGIGSGDVNFIWSAEWEHRSRLETEDRDFASQPYAINPAPWSPLTNLATWRGHNGPVPGTFGSGLLPTNANEFGTNGSLYRDFTPASCEAVGGIYNPSGVAAGVPSCSYGYISYYNLVEENDIYRTFGQLKAAITDNMDFHIDASYGQVMSPEVFGSPAQPVIRGPARATGATDQFYVPITNPYAAAFAASVGAPGTTNGFTALTYRAFAHGGNPFLGRGEGFGTPSKIDNQIWRVSGGINGTLGDWAGPLQDIGYDLALTYNQSNSFGDAPDVIGYRLQEALAGFGGPKCQVADDNPNIFGTQNSSVGTSAAARAALNCYYWNPFSTSFAKQPELGLANPRYVAGTENREDVARYIFDDRATETINNSLTADLVFNGRAPIQLPGGDIGWALGGQVRQIEFREVVNSPIYNGNLLCDWPTNSTTAVGGVPTVQRPLAPSDPAFNGCTPDGPGPFVFFGINPPNYNDQQQWSEFGELQIPLLDNLNIQAAVRREDFSGGLGATVYKVSGKWDVFGPISLRGSYGTNYQAPPAGLISGNVANGVLSYTRAAGSWLGSQVVTRSDIAPETATAWNAGVIWDSQGFAADHDLQIIVDYFNIETEDELGLLASNEQIANGVFRLGATASGKGAVDEADAFASRQGTTLAGKSAVNTNAAFADCSHPLIGRVSFNGGGCVQGVTQASALNSIRTEYGNGPGQHTAGYDVQITYRMPVGPGDLTASMTGTFVTIDENSPTVLDGFTLVDKEDRLGFLNFATVGAASNEIRANASLNYRMAQHNFRVGANFVSGVEDERGSTTPGGLVPGTSTCTVVVVGGACAPGTLGPALGLTTWGIAPKDWLSFDFTYLFELTENLRLTATVSNITDKDPPQSRQELGYDPRIGSPLGRTFEIGIKNTF